MSYECTTIEVARDLTNYLLGIGASYVVVCSTDKIKIFAAADALTEAIREVL